MTDEKKNLNDEMWNAIFELNALQSPPVISEMTEEEMAFYHPGEMLGSEEEIEEARIRLFDALEKGADINDRRSFEENGELKGILSYVADAGLADDLVSYGADIREALKDHKQEILFENDEIKEAETAVERAYHTDLLKIHQEMAEFLEQKEKEKEAYALFERLFDEEKGAFVVLEDEEKTEVDLKRSLTDKERADLKKCLAFYEGVFEEKLPLIRSKRGWSADEADLELGGRLFYFFDMFYAADEGEEN